MQRCGDGVGDFDVAWVRILVIKFLPGHFSVLGKRANVKSIGPLDPAPKI